jgi:hypothetical protein
MNCDEHNEDVAYCPSCLADYWKHHYEAEKRRIAELESHVERLHSLSSALLQELIEASYAAQCGCNHPACKQCQADGELSKFIDDSKILHASTPAQSLAVIVSKEVNNFLENFMSVEIFGEEQRYSEGFEDGRNEVCRQLLDYNKQLRGEE